MVAGFPSEVLEDILQEFCVSIVSAYYNDCYGVYRFKTDPKHNDEHYSHSLQQVTLDDVKSILDTLIEEATT
jgi:hypothetical protein